MPAGVVGVAGLDALSRACGDAIEQTPARRWRLPPLQAAAAAHGGFLHGAECFDNSFFNISAAEASVMDPQQRLLLEMGYTALHGAGLTKARLVSSDTGVYLGIQAIDWTVGSATLLPPSRRGSSYAVTGGTLSVAAGRLSFVLGLHGP